MVYIKSGLFTEILWDMVSGVAGLFLRGVFVMCFVLFFLCVCSLCVYMNRVIFTTLFYISLYNFCSTSNSTIASFCSING